MASEYSLQAISGSGGKKPSKGSDRYENFHIDKELDKIGSRIKKKKKHSTVIA